MGVSINPFDQYRLQVARACEFLKIDAARARVLFEPERVIHEMLPVHIRGELVEVPAYRVQFNSARGPYKGGIRFHP
jgi:glutamate dehydrogenase (NAD(P)+)